MNIKHTLATTLFVSVAFVSPILYAQTTTSNTGPATKNRPTQPSAKTPSSPPTTSVTPTPASPPTTAQKPGKQFSPQQVKSIEKIIHEYIVNNPEILVEAGKRLQQKMQQKQQQMAMQAISTNKQALFNDPASPVAGNINGSVTLVEFFDYQCGHCKAMGNTIKELLKDNPNLRIIFKEWPIFGNASRVAAKAALASVKQKKYLVFHNALLAASNPLTKDKILQVAKSVGINVPKLLSDMKNPAFENEIKSTFKVAEKIGLIGTPAFILTNKAETKFGFIPGATSLKELQQNVDQLQQQ